MTIDFIGRYFVVPYIITLFFFMPIALITLGICKLFGFERKSKQSFLLRLIRNNKFSFVLIISGIILISLKLPGILYISAMLLAILTAFSAEYYLPGYPIRYETKNPEFSISRVNNDLDNNTYTHDYKSIGSGEHNTTFPEYNPASGFPMMGGGAVDTAGNPHGMNSFDHASPQHSSSFDHSNSYNSH